MSSAEEVIVQIQSKCEGADAEVQRCAGVGAAATEEHRGAEVLV